MQTQRSHSEGIETDTTSPSGPSAPHRRRRRLAGLGALLFAGLLIAASALIFSLAGRSHAPEKPGNGQTPPAGQWKAVQQGYQFLSIKAAAGNPAVLYACATASAAVSNQNTPGAVTILRSADEGNSWHNVGGQMLRGSNCELAVSPANSDDVYVFNGGSSSQAPATLYHSTDGGKTWQAIQPSLTAPSSRTTQRLVLQQLEFAGSSLLAINSSTRPLPVQPSPDIAQTLMRLVRSSDGGRTWTILDSQFDAQGLAAESYAADPGQVNTIYDLVGHLWLPIERVPPLDSVPSYGINQHLYKTTDGGAHWALVLDKALFGSTVQLATGNPSIIYVGGFAGPLPLTPVSPREGAGTTLPEVVSGGFHLMVSRDAGATWQTVVTAPNQQTLLDWFVSTDGRVFSSTMPLVVPGASTTVIVETAIAGTAVPVPSWTSQVGQSQAHGSGTSGSAKVNSSGSSNSPAAILPSPGKGFILSYGPARNSWSTVATLPASGALLSVTPANATGEAVLWYMGTGTSATQYTLYRYVV